VRNRAKHANVLEYAFVDTLESDLGPLRLPLALQEDDRVSISLQCRQESVQFLQERVFIELTSGGTLRLSVTRVAGNLVRP
jgi:hypothetical protein